MSRLTLLSAPAVEPLTLAETKLYCKVETSFDDSLLNAFIATARRYVEEYIKRVLITQTWRISYDYHEFPLDLHKKGYDYGYGSYFYGHGSQCGFWRF